jgi:hypothetical protein
MALESADARSDTGSRAGDQGAVRWQILPL